MVAGFIALLKVAVTTGVLGQTRVEASGGVTNVTVGEVKGSAGAPAGFSSGSPQPVKRAASMNGRNAEIQSLLTFNLRIRFSFSLFTQPSGVQRFDEPPLRYTNSA